MGKTDDTQINTHKWNMAGVIRALKRSEQNWRMKGILSHLLNRDLTEGGKGLCRNLGEGSRR